MSIKFVKLFVIGLVLAVNSLPIFAFDSEAMDFKVEVRANYRDSEDLALAAPFPPGAFQRTVDPGDHAELSRITLFGKIQFTERWQLVTKFDAVDLYERNPTTSDRTFDIDTFILRNGTKHTHGLISEEVSVYGQFGKFGAMERQEDRHLESYGLVSTAFNRLEDTGFEFGIDFPSGVYSKLSYTTGAPVFFRDPNALAGDNGVEFGKDAEDPDFNSGMVILYDAEVEDLDLSENPETSFGLGYRWLAESGSTRLNILFHHNKRGLADTIELNGTGYGGDLDLLQVVPSELPPGTILAPVGLPIDSESKNESGLTVWLYHNNFAWFSQYVDQDIAGLDRDGWEVEMSYLFNEVPLIASITPAFRYSKLRPDFTTSDPYPAMSVTWDWTKIDFGADFEVNDYVNVLIEHSTNTFVRKSKNETYGETLVTLVLGYKF
jgi:hypothetical protein